VATGSSPARHRVFGVRRSRPMPLGSTTTPLVNLPHVRFDYIPTCPLNLTTHAPEPIHDGPYNSDASTYACVLSEMYTRQQGGPRGADGAPHAYVSLSAPTDTVSRLYFLDASVQSAHGLKSYS
jgi:hypothetical protein